MCDSIIDPRLLGGSSQARPLTETIDAALPSQNRNEQDSSRNDEGIKERQKLNLWKCKPCRDARKKCWPNDRIWPQKCNRCLQHRPELECSEPQLNRRKRGPNLSKPVPNSKKRATSERSEPRDPSDSDSDDLADELYTYERPVRITMPKRIKKEHAGVEFVPSAAVGKKDRLPAFTYASLNKDEFRIVRVAPGRKDDRIMCWLVVTSISQPLNYEALTYSWGDMRHFNEIELRSTEASPSERFAIGNNLYSLLRSLRHPSNTMSFWVDAICINQNNAHDKTRQAELMRDIYNSAQNICVWLGDDAIPKAGLTFIPRMLDLTEVDELTRDAGAMEGWTSFSALLKSPVFSGRWLLQEVVVAQNVTLHCGKHSIHYADFVDAVGIFKIHQDEISKLFWRHHKSSRDLIDQRITRTEKFIDITSNALRWSREGKVLQRLFSLETLVSLLGDFVAADPRDTVFALLALAKDGPELFQQMPLEDSMGRTGRIPIQVDWAKSTLQVYQEFVVHVIASSQSLDIFCRPWASPTLEKLPSWIRATQLPPLLNDIPDRTNADSLVGLPDRKFYSASERVPAQFRTESHPDWDKVVIMFVKGFKLGSIDEIGPRASQGTILYEWFELGGCDISADGDTTPGEFWRTLVADRGHDGCKPPSWYERAFMYCLAQKNANGDINTNELIDTSGADACIVVSFLRRVQSVIWNRKFFVSKANRWIGLAPTDARVGDLICILYGCSVPVILRPQTVDGRDVWILIGECYVHGLMDGEAMERTNVTGFESEEFELR